MQTRRHTQINANTRSSPHATLDDVFEASMPVVRPKKLWPQLIGGLNPPTDTRRNASAEAGNCLIASLVPALAAGFSKSGNNYKTVSTK
ncbi:unnamed protein product [Protopolystoma xenopodis]|uniref:Uncharacterized protein n=1 Tax=Protopolystoma xenopodis TaxID=117903 RepID=A0A3S5BSL3_9PLAT|nr:unnamed protein product [Protopolystoma xenopodis]